MIRVSRSLVCGGAALALTITAAAPARAQFGPNLHGTTVALNVDLPIGKFDQQVKTGFGVALRTGLGDTEDTWSGRGSFGFDYFKGSDIAYDNVQFITTGFDIVHRSSDAFYQFGGLALHNTRYTFAGSGSTFSRTASQQNFGLTGGVGVNFGTGNVKGFVEFAATTVFTPGANSAWFPVKVGLRF